tara:strand:+ start:298 stop:729 length:432 start_codon:yes stop_codon:yes gene_type:complete
MIFKILKKTIKDNEISNQNELIKVAALLVHAAKIDDNYSEKEKTIIAEFLKSANGNIDVDNIIKKAEEEENNSNQILKYTQEIKKNTLEFRTKIVKVLWKIILSDEKSDMYETNLMRRICGLLYLPDRLCGEIKLEIQREKKI